MAKRRGAGGCPPHLVARAKNIQWCDPGRQLFENICCEQVENPTGG